MCFVSIKTQLKVSLVIELMFSILYCHTVPSLNRLTSYYVTKYNFEFCCFLHIHMLNFELNTLTEGKVVF